MKTINLGRNTFTIYQSIKELPAALFSDMQKYILQDAGIGSDIHAVNAHFNKWDLFTSKGQYQEARQERINLQQNIFLMLNGINITSYAFACLIYAIDGKPVTDYSEANLKELIAWLSKKGLTVGLVQDTLNEVKKNLIPN